LRHSRNRSVFPSTLNRRWRQLTALLRHVLGSGHGASRRARALRYVTASAWQRDAALRRKGRRGATEMKMRSTQLENW